MVTIVNSCQKIVGGVVAMLVTKSQVFYIYIFFLSASYFPLIFSLPIHYVQLFQ